MKRWKTKKLVFSFLHMNCRTAHQLYNTSAVEPSLTQQSDVSTQTVDLDSNQQKITQCNKNVLLIAALTESVEHYLG